MAISLTYEEWIQRDKFLHISHSPYLVCLIVILFYGIYVNPHFVIA